MATRDLGLFRREGEGDCKCVFDPGDLPLAMWAVREMGMIDTNEPDDAAEYRTETVHVYYDPETDVGVSETVVLGVAEVAGVDPIALEPLFDTIDPDVLNEFVDSGGLPEVEGRISFTFGGHDVTVYASGLVEIEPERE